MPDTALEPVGKRIRHLGRNEVAALLALHHAGKTQVEIAQTLDIDQSNVSRWLDKLVDTTDLAKHTLRNGAVALAEKVVENADVDQALEVLDRLDVAPKRQANSNSAVNILIGMPGQAIGPDVQVIATPPSPSLVPRNEIDTLSTG